MASKPHPDDVEKITRLFAGWSGFQNVPLEEIETKCKRRVEVEKLFTPEQYGKLSDFEKKRLKNINRTMSIKYYLELPLPSERDLRAKVGLPPIFTNSDTSSEESDEEWTPRKPTPKKNPGFTSVADIMKRTRFITKNCTVKNEKYEEKPDSDELKVVKDSMIPMRTKSGKLVTSSGGTISEKKVSKEVKKVEPPKPVVKEKYPLRDIPKKCYEEYKVPTEDDFLFCDDCEKLHLGDCPVHGPFQKICDTPVKMGIEDRAKKTCPAGISIGVSKIRGGGLGAWCDTEFPKNCVFGPYEGVQVERNDVQKLQKLFQGGYSWEIYKKGQLSHYIDGNDKNQSNWLRYINCAREEPEQNVIAYQYQGNIYYRTYKPVKKGMELLVWYGNQYAKSLGIPLEYRIKEVAAATKAQICFDDYSRCSKCEKVFADDETLARHMKSKHPDRSVVKRHKCPWCQYSSDHSKHVERHKLTHTKEKPHKCDMCDKAFTQKGDLKRHKLTHSGIKPYKCEICGKDFTKVSNLRKHKNTVHEKSKSFVCEVCSKAFGQAGSLKLHMRTHTGEQPYKCKHCDKRFAHSNSLHAHERTHTGEKPYKCEHCGKRFAESGHLRAHERTHTGEKPYKCEHCDKRFAHSNSLRDHERTHTGEKPYKCEHCSQAFTQLSSLRSHVITIHTKRFPHVCHVCDKGFILPNQLKSHIEKHHPTSESK